MKSEKKVFIYDTSKGFSSLIKHYYSTKINIDTCTNKNFFLEKINDYDACFFIVNDMDDYLNLMKIYCKIGFFFISSPDKFIFKKIESLNFEDTILLDFNEKKGNLLRTINYNLIKNKLI